MGDITRHVTLLTGQIAIAANLLKKNAFSRHGGHGVVMKAVEDDQPGTEAYFTDIQFHIMFRQAHPFQVNIAVQFDLKNSRPALQKLLEDQCFATTSGGVSRHTWLLRR